MRGCGAVGRHPVAHGGDKETSGDGDRAGVARRSATLVAVQPFPEVVKTPVQCPHLVVENGVADGRAHQRFPDGRQAYRGLFDGRAGTLNRALQLGQLLQERDRFLRGGSRQGSLGHLNHFEGLLLVHLHLGEHAVLAFGQADAVGSRNGQGALRGIPEAGLLFLLGLPGLHRGVAQIPGDAVEACSGRTGQAAHDLARCVPNREDDRGVLLALLEAQLLPAGVGCVAALLFDLLLGLAALRLAGLDLIAQVVGEHRAKGRVGRGEERPALAGLLVAAQRPALDIPPGPAHRKQLGLLPERLLGDVPQRGVVVEDVEAAAERGSDQVVLAALDRQVAERDVGRPAAQLDPPTAAIHREEDAELGAHEQQ